MPSVTSADVLDRPAEPPDLVLVYAEHPDGVIDVYLPPAETPLSRSQLLVAVHGGFWRQAYDRTHLRSLAAALAQRGYVVALPEYRRVGGRGGWPTTAYDVEAAVQAAAAGVATAAPNRLDPADPFQLVGHSAGGHLALWAGLRAGARRISGIVALAPVTDLRYGAEHRIGSGAVQAFLGGGPDDVPENYAAAAVLDTLPSDVPVTVIHGTDDDAVPVEMSRRLARRYAVDEDAPTGLCLRYLELDGVDHFALIDPLSDAFTTVVRSLDLARSWTEPPPP